jgi:hypothetical protein
VEQRLALLYFYYKGIATLCIVSDKRHVIDRKTHYAASISQKAAPTVRFHGVTGVARGYGGSAWRVREFRPAVLAEACRNHSVPSELLRALRGKVLHTNRNHSVRTLSATLCALR